jgi:hypothetical protein
MSISPRSTAKVLVTTTSQFVLRQAANVTKAVVYNAGPSLIFIEATTAAGAASANGSYPLPAGQTQSFTVPGSDGYGIALVGEGSGVAYVSYVAGDLEAVSALSLEP